jgi:hypothetical protein
MPRDGTGRDQRQVIFSDDRDHGRFAELLEEMKGEEDAGLSQRSLKIGSTGV